MKVLIKDPRSWAICREFSVKDETFPLWSAPVEEIDLDQLLIIASPSNQQLSDHIPKS